MKNISFSLTTPQFRAKTKTVTRRLGWLKAKPGDRLMGVEKGMGLKKGEKVVRLGEIEVVSVKREKLGDIRKYPHGGTSGETAREGFPDMLPGDFCAMFGKHNDCSEGADVTRIEFKYIV